MDSNALPRHWLGPEELESSYWSNPEVREKRGQEFFDKPIETLERIEKLDSQGFARRDFLTIMGASMAMAGFACARRPVHKIIPYVVKPEEITPGVPVWYASTCPDTGEGVLIKNREGRPIKLEGNPDHPVNRGALSARTQASLLDLYDPDRLGNPVARGRDGGSRREVSWAVADAAIGAALKKRGKVRILSAPLTGGASRRLAQEFLSASAPDARLVEYEPLAQDDVADGQAECYGKAVLPRYRYDRASVVVSLAHDFLGVGPDEAGSAAGWSQGRKLDASQAKKARMSRLFVFESIMSLTGANADERFPVRPGDELRVALAIAHELIVTKRQSRFAGDSAVSQALTGHSPEAVAQATGLYGGAATIRRVATALWEARGKGLVVAGSVAARTRDALALQVVANLLNSALENEGATVDGGAGVVTPPSFAAFEKLVAEMKAGQVDVLVLNQVNPAYGAPAMAGFVSALARVPLVVAIADREDETARLADYVLPSPHWLESWGDAHARRGVYSLQQPALHPIRSTRAFEDTLLAWIKAAELKPASLAGRVAWAAEESSWHDYLKASWRETVYKEAGSLAPFAEFWEGALRSGVVQTAAASAAPAPRAFRTAALARLANLEKLAAQPADSLSLALYAKSGLYDGRQANNPWLQEMPDPVSTATWDNYALVAPATAKRLSIRTDDVLEVTAGERKVQLPALVQPGLHPGVVAVAVGYGRTAAGKIGDRVGVDAFPWVAVENGRAVFSGLPVQIRKTGGSYKIAQTQWHHASENRPVINDITLAEFRTDPAASNHTDPHLRMKEVPTIWREWEYKGHKWGMAIDLSSCTGCGACVVACQAENNIPTVGRDNVRISREMHWIRIDRYYSGSPDRPEVVFQPMLCQHCDNAPCETVCPVLATVHNNEGLNEQVYNRCVGTRYCQNNCPYKVRRFNFFDHWKAYEGTLNLAWNPDVTVRSRGIMEKCTFCVQRIRAGKEKAKDQGRKLRDGDVVVACQQTCPTEAIVFGDLNDPAAKVAKLAADQRAFRVLEVLNTRPAISYLTKVRNHEGAPHDHGKAQGATHG